MDTELNLFKSLDDFFNLMMRRHPLVVVFQFHSFYDYVNVMKQRDPSSFGQLPSFQDLFKLLKQRDPNLFAQFKSLDHFFNEIKLSNPNSFALELGKRIATPSDYTVHYREICAELLRMLLTGDRDLCTWHNLPVSTQSAIKTNLLYCLMHEEQSFYITCEVRNIIVKLVPSLITGNNSWPELLPCLYQCLTSSTSHDITKCEDFTMLGVLAEEIGEIMFSSLKNSFHSILRKTLFDDALNVNVRVAAMYAAIEFIICVSSSNEKEQFQDLLAGMMKLLSDAVSSPEEELFYRKEIPLTRLIKLAKNEPRFLRIQLVDVVSTVLDIVEAGCLEEEVRREGVEFLLTLVEAKEKAPGMMKKLPLFIGRCFAMLLKLLVLDIKDDPAWHSAENVGDVSGITSTFKCGCNGLARFCRALGDKSVTHDAKEQLSAYLAAAEWEKRHAALIALDWIVEGCSKVITKNQDDMRNMVLKRLQDPHPRVRMAACRAIAIFFKYFKPHVQEEYYDQVYLEVSLVMDDFHPRVQASAMTALSIICWSNKLEALVPHLDRTVNKLLVLLQNEKQIVQQGAVTALGVVAHSVEDYFQTYYDTVMPHLRGFLRSTDHKSDISLRAAAIHCISSIGSAVGREKFREDAKQIIEVFMPLQGLQERIAERTTWEILWGCVRICDCMGKEFLPYLSEVITLLIQSATWNDENYGVADPTSWNNNSIEKVMFRDKNLWKTYDFHLMEKSARACNLLEHCIEILKEDFYPWIPKAVSVLVPLVKFHSNNLVRKYAIKALPSMLCCAKLAVAKGIAQDGSESYFMELADNIIKTLIETLHKEQVLDLCVTMLDMQHKCLKICGPLLDEGLLRIIVDEIMHIITDSLSRKQELTQRTKFEGFDDEEAEMLLNDERWLEGKIFSYICEILRELINAFKVAFLPFLDELSSYLLPMLVMEKTIISERFYAISIFTDLVAKCPEAAGKYYELYFPLILGLSDDEEPQVREMALYGLRLWAIYGRSSFKHYVGDALSTINKVIMHSKALEPENEIAYNYAVSALGTICEFYGESIDLAQVIPVWLNCLPIKAALFEAKVVHNNLLCSMVERSQKELFGPHNEYIPKIVAVLVEVFSKNDLAFKETPNRIIDVLRHLQQTIPTTTLLSGLPYLLPQHAMELKSILSLEDDEDP